MTSKPSCPHCRAPLFRREVTHVVEDPCAKKLEVIAEMALELKSPVIVFVQWRRMLRSIKAVLSDTNCEWQRWRETCAKGDCLCNRCTCGGVLLLCIEDSFAVCIFRPLGTSSLRMHWSVLLCRSRKWKNRRFRVRSDRSDEHRQHSFDRRGKNSRGGCMVYDASAWESPK